MRDPSLTLGARDATGHIITANPNPNLTQKMLKDLLYLGVKPTLHQQYLSLEKMVTEKMLSLLNAQMVNQERIYEGLRRDNLRLNSQVQD